MSIELHFGDGIERMRQMPDKSVDLIISDPPYGISYNQNDLASKWESVFGGDKNKEAENGIQNDGYAEAMDIFSKFLAEAKRVLRKGACCCCCCGGGGPKPLFAEWTLMMDKAIGFKHAVVWDKGGLGMGLHYRRNYEFVLVAQKGSPAHRWNGGNSTANVWRIGKIIPSADQHPTVKPVELFKKMIHLHSDPGDLVIDPFMGSGSSGVAAAEMGRSFIGCEIEERFYKMAQERMADPQSQLRMDI